MGTEIKLYNDGSNMLDVAMAYSGLGWAVLPVAPGTKPPAVNWKEYQERLPTEKELLTWFEGKTNIQVGITLVTGAVSGVTIVDIDDPVQRFSIPGTTRVRSGGGGVHYYYKYQPEIKSLTKHGGKPVDTKSDGGVIVLPPTIHPNGVQYTWERFDVLEKFPLRFWRENFPEAEKKEAGVVMLPEEFAKELLDFKVMAPGDGRNDALVRLLGKLRRHFTDAGTFEVLARYISSTADHPLSNKEVTAMLRQAHTWEGPPVISPPEILNRSQLADELVALKKLEEGAPSTGYSELDREITGFLPGNVYMLSGETNSGKTLVAANFAHNVAKQGKRVLYIALEPQERILNYFCSIDKKIPFTDIGPTEIGTMSPVMDMVDYIKNCSSLEELQGVLEGATGYSMIIIDHIGYFVSGGPGDSLQKQQDLMKRLPQLARKKSCAVLAIAHVRKKSQTTGKKKGRQLDGFDIAGSGAFIQDATDVLLIRRFFEDEDIEAENNRFRPEGGIIVSKTKNPQKGATGYAHVYFTPDSALLEDKKTAAFSSDPTSMGIVRRSTPGEVVDIFKDMM